MITRIGLVAGDIWNYLDAHKNADYLNNIVAGLGTDRDIILMSLGWLAREGHVVLEGLPANYLVQLTGRNGQ
jgi:hypothetical protein